MAARVRLTQRLVWSLQTPEHGERLIMDADVKGLGVRVRTSGHMSYVIRWHDPQGRVKKMTLGDARSVRLDVAREIALGHFAGVARGEYPSRRQQHGTTMRDLATETLEHITGMGGSEKYVRDTTTFFDHFILPALGETEVDQITRKQVEALIMSLASKPRTANRVRSTFGRAMRLAIQIGLRTDNPVEGVSKFPERPRERFFSQGELERLWGALEAIPEKDHDKVAVVRLLYLTGARPGELLSARWEHIDLESAIWTKPANSTKMRRIHRVELSPQSVGILRGLRPKSAPATGYVFPREGRHSHLTNIDRFWRRVTRSAGLADARLYDLRKTTLTMLMASGVDLRTVMSISSHSSPTTLLRHYAHSVEGTQRRALEGLMEFPDTTKQPEQDTPR